MKVVVFDLDETIGNFQQLGILWDIMENDYTRRINKKDIFEILDKFPKLIRPGFIQLLSTLKKNNIKTAIFTNNQGPPSWVEMFSNYLSYKIGRKAFNRIVKSYDNEPCRTSDDKKISDFFNCTKYPKNTKLCFIDDQYHSFMDEKQVYYIHVKPYEFHYSFNEMIERLMSSRVGKQLVHRISKKSNTPVRETQREISSNFQKQIKPYKFSITKTKVSKDDYLVSNEMKKHIQYFLNEF